MYGWGFPAYPQRRFYFRGSEDCISVRFKQSVNEIQPCIEVVFFFRQCLLYFLWYVCFYLKKSVEKQIPPIYSPLEKISGLSTQLFCLSYMAIFASCWSFRKHWSSFRERQTLAMQREILCGIMSRVCPCISHRYLFSSSGRTLWLYSGSTEFGICWWKS